MSGEAMPPPTSKEEWTPGTKQPSPFASDPFVSIDPDKEGMYSLLISGVTPRPVAFVSTLNEEGIGNLAPFSFFNVVTHDPPTVMIGIVNNAGGVRKDTLKNIEATKEFVVNIVGDWMVESKFYSRQGHSACLLLSLLALSS
jgi:hypothetical protein